MELYQLEYFLCISEKLNYSRAAGFEPTFSIITSDVPTALELLRQNRTLCFAFPGFRVKEQEYHARLRRLVCRSEENFSTYAVTRKHVTLPPAARAFLISLQKYLTEEENGAGDPIR